MNFVVLAVVLNGWNVLFLIREMDFLKKISLNGRQKGKL